MLLLGNYIEESIGRSAVSFQIGDEKYFEIFEIFCMLMTITPPAVIS